MRTDYLMTATVKSVTKRALKMTKSGINGYVTVASYLECFRRVTYQAFYMAYVDACELNRTTFLSKHEQFNFYIMPPYWTSLIVLNKTPPGNYVSGFSAKTLSMISIYLRYIVFFANTQNTHNSQEK